MRLWKLSEFGKLYKVTNKLIIHICDKCKHKTPIPREIYLTPNFTPENIIDVTGNLEIKENSCDACNIKALEHFINEIMK